MKVSSLIYKETYMKKTFGDAGITIVQSKTSKALSALFFMMFFPISLLATEENLIQNPGFEKRDVKNESMPDGFVFGKYSDGKGTASIDDKIVHSGKYSLRVEKSNNEGWVSAYQTKTIPALTAPRKFSISVWMLAEDAKGSVIVWGDDGVKRQVQWTSIANFHGSFDWKKISGTVNFPAGVKSITLSVRILAKCVIWIDDCNVTAAAEDLITVDSGNLILNPEMKGAAAGNTGLPAGWQKKMVDWLETAGDFKIAEGPAGKTAIAMEWKHGGPRFGIEAEQQVIPVADCGFEFSAFARASGGSSAVLIAEALGKDGNIISEWRSEPVVSTDWRKVKLLFRTPAAATKIMVYCFNEGQGKVSFASAQLQKNTEGKAAVDFPIQAVCIPPEITKEFNSGKGEFNTFAEKPCPLTFEFKGKAPAGKKNSLVIELPKNVKLMECFNSHNGWNLKEEKPEKEHIMRDGKAYVRYTITNPVVFGGLAPGWSWERKLVIALLPEDTKSVGFQGMTFWYMKSGDDRSAENSFALNILPPMAPTPNPKIFPLIFWDTFDINFNNSDIMEKIANTYEEIGATFRGRDSGKAGERDKLLEKRGWKMIVSIPDYMRIKFSLNGNGWDKIKDKIEYSLKDNGALDKSRLCPQFMIDDADFRTYLNNYLLENIGKFGLKNGETICLDIEPWQPMEWCYCQRCRSDFAAYCKMSHVPDTAGIKSKYKTEWRVFRCRNTAEVQKMFIKTLKAKYPDSKIGDYDYVVKFNQPDFKDLYLSVAKDPQLNEKDFDFHISSYYQYIDKNAFDLIDVNVKNLAKDYWVLGAIDRAGTYLGPKHVITPEQARMLILAAAASGAKGAGFYPGLYIDGKFILAIDQAMFEIAAVEKLLMEGKRIDSEINALPLPYYSKKIQTGNRILEIVRPVWKDFFGYRAHALNNIKLLSLFNYSPETKAFVKISTLVPAGKYTILDPVINKKIIPSSGENSWNASDIAAGFIYAVPPRDVRFLLIRPVEDKDANLPVSGYSKKIEAEFENSKNLYSDATAAVEPVKQGKMSIGYDDINNDGKMEITLSAPSQKLWIDPECGGILTEWQSGDKFICKSQLDSQNDSKSMCWDFFWLPKSIRHNGSETAKVSVVKTQIKDDYASVTLKNKLAVIPIEIFKTYELNAGGNGFNLIYRFKNYGDKPVFFSFWSHNFPKLDKEKLNENMMAMIPLKEGIKEINKCLSEFVFSSNSGDVPGFASRGVNGILSGNHIGVWSLAGKYGIIAKVEQSKIMAVYLYWQRQTTVEWMYNEISLSPGEEWQTSITYSFFDKSDINSFRNEVKQPQDERPKP